MFAGLFKGLKDLIYPNCCLVCRNKIESNTEPAFACAGCLSKVEKNLPPFCANCGRHLNAESIKKNTCANCKNTKFYFDRAFGPCIYAGTIKKLICEFKYSGRDYLGSYFGSIMSAFIRDYNLPIQQLDYIIPVPLHKSRLREREFNQAQILSQKVAREFNKKVLTGALIRNKPTKTQTGLNSRERKENMENGFWAVKPEQIKGANLLLIDDVLTTAATANAAAKSLKNAGAKTIILLTLAN